MDESLIEIIYKFGFLEWGLVCALLLWVVLVVFANLVLSNYEKTEKTAAIERLLSVIFFVFVISSFLYLVHRVVFLSHDGIPIFDTTSNFIDGVFIYLTWGIITLICLTISFGIIGLVGVFVLYVIANVFQIVGNITSDILKVFGPSKNGDKKLSAKDARLRDDK